MLESSFKRSLIKSLEKMFPGCIVLHPDPQMIQGIPDIIILYKSKWAALEGKRSEKEMLRSSKTSHGYNQNYYISKMNDMSYAAFIYPENKEAVLSELQEVFGS